MAATDAKPVPKKNVAHRVTFPIWDADGDLVTGATGLDSEVSIDGGNFADCASEATEIQSTGMYFLDLTQAEMNGDTIAIIVKTTSVGAKTTPIVLYPEEAGDIRADATMISGDATAADNLELQYDGTGLTGNTFPATQLQADTIDNFVDTEVAAILTAVDTEVAAILADTNELQVDWANGGRLDLLIDAILADTAELQTDWTNGGRLDLLIDAILADTAELQTDWADGGRLDLILDSRASQTSVNTIDDFLDTEVAAILAAVDTEITTLLTNVNTIDDFLDTEIGTLITNVAAILVSTTRFETMIQLDGAVYKFTTNALEDAPAGGGDLVIEVQRGVNYGPFAFVMVDSNGNPLDNLDPVNCSVMLDGAVYVATTTPTATFVSNGTYYVNLVAADVDAKDIMFRAEATGAATLYLKMTTQTQD